MTYTDSKKLEERPKNVKEYKLGVALPTNETAKLKKYTKKNKYYPPHFQIKPLSLHLIFLKSVS